MERNAVVETIANHQNKLHQDFDVAHMAIFGSVARNEARSDSDVDILVEFSHKPTFDGFMDLKFYLEELLNKIPTLFSALKEIEEKFSA